MATKKHNIGEARSAYTDRIAVEQVSKTFLRKLYITSLTYLSYEALRNMEVGPVIPDRYTVYPFYFEQEVLVPAKHAWEDLQPLKRANLYACALEAHIAQIHNSLKKSAFLFYFM